MLSVDIFIGDTLRLLWQVMNALAAEKEKPTNHEAAHTKRRLRPFFLIAVAVAAVVGVWLPLSWHFRFRHVGGDGDTSNPWSFASQSSDEQPPPPVPPVRYENGMLYLNYEEDSRGEAVCDTATRVFIAIESAAEDQDSRMAARNTCV